LLLIRKKWPRRGEEVSVGATAATAAFEDDVDPSEDKILARRLGCGDDDAVIVVVVSSNAPVEGCFLVNTNGFIVVASEKMTSRQTGPILLFHIVGMVNYNYVYFLRGGSIDKPKR
jgi:hypothetical protein